MVGRFDALLSKYGPEFGPVLRHVMQSRTARAGVSNRLRHKQEVLMEGRAPAPMKLKPLLPSVEAEEALALVEACDRAR